LRPITNVEIIQQWSAIPRAVVEAFGDEGDFAHQHLLNPTLFALLGSVQGKQEYFLEYRIEGRWSCRFHRPLSDYLNALVQRGGVLQAVVEPRLDSEQARAVPEAARNFHVPSFIVIQVNKGMAELALFA
jgi:hypothetical protein